MDRQNSLPSSPPGEDITLETRRKIAVMKKALLKEREEKQKEFEELENMKKKLSILELTLSEKDSQIQISNSEREILERDLKKLKENSKQISMVPLDQGSKKSVATLEQQNKKLLEEYNIIKQHNTELKTKFTNLSQQHQEIQKQITLKDNHLNSVMNELKESLADTIRQQEASEKDLSVYKNAYASLSDNQNKLKNEYNETALKQKQLEEEIIALNKDLQVKQNQIKRLNEKLMKQSENEATLSNKLMQYKNELVEAESYYQKHEATRLNSLNNQPAIIVLKHDHTGEYVIEIEERKNKLMYGISNIGSIAMHPHSDKRFFIRFIEGQVFEFEANDACAIVGKMNFFLTKARGDQ